MAKTDLIKVLIVDDHPVVREGIARIISTDNAVELVGEAGSAQEFLQLYRKTQPDAQGDGYENARYEYGARANRKHSQRIHKCARDYFEQF